MWREGRVPILKNSPWLLLRREHNLKDDQRFRLRDLLRYNLRTVQAYLLKEAFQQLWDYNSPASADSRSITQLPNSQSRKPPTIFSDES